MPIFTLTPEMIEAGAAELIFDNELSRSVVAEEVIRAALEAAGYEIA